MLVRPATEADVAGVLQIVNREIREGIAHFGLQEHAPEDVRAWVGSAARLPFLVAVTDEQVLGYARASRWKDREAYDWACEIGVYVSPASQGQGVGRALYGVLLPRLTAMGYRSIIAGIALPNLASVRLHEAFGMKHLGTFPKVGFKLGRWIDVGYWALTAGDGPPRAIASTKD